MIMNSKKLTDMTNEIKGHLIGKNGNIEMWLMKDHTVNVYTDGVHTAVILTTDGVRRWRRILGMR